VDADGFDGWTTVVPSRNLAWGLQTFYAQATDNEGALSREVGAAPWVSVAVLNQPPSGGYLRVGPDPFYRPMHVLLLEAFGVSDLDGTVKLLTFYWETNGVPGLQTGPAGDSNVAAIPDPGPDASWFFGGTNLSDGTYTFYAQATDNDGSLGPALQANVTVLNVPPILESLDSSPPELIQGDPLVLTARGVYDLDFGGVQKVEFFRRAMPRGNTEPIDISLGTGTDHGDFTWSWSGTSVDFPLGANLLLARAFDGKDWSGTATLDILVNPPAFDGGPGNDRFEVRPDTTGQYVDIFANAPTSGPPTRRIARDAFSSLVVNGGDGDDILIMAPGLPCTPIFNGGTGVDTLDIRSGSHSFATDAVTGTANLNLVVTGDATVTFECSQHLASLVISDQGRVSFTPRAPTGRGGKIIHTGGLGLGFGATLDLADNDLIVNNGDLDAITGAIKSAWLIGKGGRHATLAAVLNDKGDGQIKLTFGGQSVGLTDVLVKYSWEGDANLDGVVNADDYFQIDSGFISQKKGWYNGDFNYDNVVNADD